MTLEEIKNLAERVKSGSATQDEELALLKELNVAVSTLRQAIKDQHTEELQDSIISDLTK